MGKVPAEALPAFHGEVATIACGILLFSGVLDTWKIWQSVVVMSRGMATIRSPTAAPKADSTVNSVLAGAWAVVTSIGTEKEDLVPRNTVMVLEPSSPALMITGASVKWAVGRAVYW